MKRGKRNLFVLLGFILIFVMASSVFAENIGLSGKTKEVIDDIVENQGIDKDDVKSVEKVEFDKLPKEVELKDIDTTNLAVYEVDYGGEAPVFVITASEELMQATPDTTVYKRMFLNFGFAGQLIKSNFLNSAAGIEGSLEQGYVMMREGSITGLSSNLEVLSGEGNVEIMVYVNGKPAGFRNTIAVDSSGIKKDYDTQSLGVVNFDKGDVISAYIIIEEGIIVKDIINLIEISTE